MLAVAPDVREEINELMSGKILELESEKQRRLGKEEELKLDAMVLHKVNAGEHDQTIIARECNCTVTEVETIMKAFGI